MKELVQILNEDGTLTNKKIDKLEAHKNGICHGISAIGLINSDGKLLLQKRVKTKKLEPGVWDFSSAGHIDNGESKKEAAVRECYEELGIKISVRELKLIDTFLLKEKISDEIYINHYTYLYVVKKDVSINDIIFNKKEISEVKYVGKKEYLNLFKNNKTVKGFKYCNNILDYMEE